MYLCWLCRLPSFRLILPLLFVFFLFHLLLLLLLLLLLIPSLPLMPPPFPFQLPVFFHLFFLRRLHVHSRIFQSPPITANCGVTRPACVRGCPYVRECLSARALACFLRKCTRCVSCVVVCDARLREVRTCRYSTLVHTKPFVTTYGDTLEGLQVAYETYGKLNKNRDNAILLGTGLSASSHARSGPKNTQPGWWEAFIGPNLAIDTNRFFVICVNNLGGCHGTTGPSSLDPRSSSSGHPDRRYGLRFPVITVRDMVNVMFSVVDHLDVDKLHAVVGSSLGGMQSLAAAALRPDRVGRLVSISGALKSHPLAIALRYAQRNALFRDPRFNLGDYYDAPFPSEGMRLAREIATVTYRSGPEWEERFGRRRVTAPGERPSFFGDFHIEKYLHHQGSKWCRMYDPNSYIVISKAMDLFSMDASLDSYDVELCEGLKNVTMPALVMGVRSDMLFPIAQQREIADALRGVGNAHVVFYDVDAPYGHDTFLIDVVSIGSALKGFLEAPLVLN
eukprot:GHVU01090056.1.p1 GENE.GHVU01090056.1~~GHVU01090056.1.p1  ORF type:complete len:506 (+),score=71.76 GHVU01090056.1:590-2107(+)